MDDVIKRLESVDTHESSSAVSRLQKRLGNAREAQLLSELVDYFIASGSTRALNVLSSLKDVQSQVRLNDKSILTKVEMMWPISLILFSLSQYLYVYS